jgi:hypothetical protein
MEPDLYKFNFIDMFFVPSIVISLITFPGIIVHELAHQLFCRWFKVPVFEVVYFQMKKPMGYVLHERTESHLQAVMISIGPFFVNTILGALIALPAAMPVFTFDNAGPLDYFLIYLGVSIAMHAFPSTGDAANVWDIARSRETPLWLRIIGWPIVVLIYIGAIGSMFWLDLLYGIGVAVGIPKLIISLMS